MTRGGTGRSQWIQITLAASWVFGAEDVRTGGAHGSVENGWRKHPRHAKGPMAARTYHGSVQTKLLSSRVMACITCSVVQGPASGCHGYGSFQTRLLPSPASRSDIACITCSVVHRYLSGCDDHGSV